MTFNKKGVQFQPEGLECCPYPCLFQSITFFVCFTTVAEGCKLGGADKAVKQLGL